MDAMKNDHLNLLADFLSEDENQELKFHSTMSTDEHGVAAAGFLFDSELYNDMDWSFDDSKLDLSTLTLLDSNLKNNTLQSSGSWENFPSESSSFDSCLGISASSSVPDQSFELEQSAGPSTCSSSSPLQSLCSTIMADTDISVEELAQILSYDPFELFEPQKTKIDPKLQNKNKISKPTITESVPHDFISSKFEDLRDRSCNYIKCQRQDLEVEETPELSGYKCYLCKRDVSVKPEGSYKIPNIPPHVSVLPCSHVFHDLCLDRITPQDQLRDPPCIPCAIADF